MPPKKPPILLIDDDDAFRRMLGITLSKLGYEVRPARDGAEAVKLFRQTPFELVLTDIVMPNQEGLETIGQLRKQHPGVKIVAMSGGGRTSAIDYLKLAKALGADGVLEKPFSSDELVLMLERTMSPRERPLE